MAFLFGRLLASSPAITYGFDVCMHFPKHRH
jgi:hypothetical protein